MTIAYIAPEIPGLSSTFVYNEIFALERLGVRIQPVSIHNGLDAPQDAALSALKQRSLHAYNRNITKLLKDNIRILFKHPRKYLQTMGHALIDAWSERRRFKVFLGILYRFFVAGSISTDLDRIDVTHLHAHFAHFPADICMYSAGILGKSFSITAHANDIFCNSWLIQKKCQRSKFIATISQYNRSFMSGLGCNEDKIEIVRCGLYESASHPTDFPPPSTPPKLGFVGRFVEKKGIATLLEACQKLQVSGTKFSLELVGDGPEMQEMLNLKKKHQLGESATFLGNMENKDVRTWLRTIDIFVMPCRQDSQGDMDGIPVALMEAMLEGKPVISSRLSGIPELVIDEQTGLLADPGNADELALKIEQLLSDDLLKSRLRTAAYSHIMEKFDGNKSAIYLRDLFYQ